MESFLIKAAQLIAALGLLVIIHEFGHYIFARIFKIKVDKFYLFFNPWFTLCKWKPKPKPGTPEGKTSWRDTEYGIGWLPLGGYCKINGMVDESLDTEAMAQEPKPWEFRSKPAYQRLMVMVGGVLFNFILAIIIYAGIALKWGTAYVPFEGAKEGYDFVDAARQVGFQNGDIPFSADGRKLDAADPTFPMKMAEAKEVEVVRNGKRVKIPIPDKFVLKLNDEKGFLALRVPVVVDKVVSGEAGEKAGLKTGDRIMAVDSIPTRAYSDLVPALENYKEKPTTVTVLRDGKEVTLSATPNEYGKLGFQLKPVTDVLPTVVQNYNLWQSVPKGWEIGTTNLGAYVSSMKHVFSKEGAESLGGFGAIGNMFPDQWSWYQFWQITAFLSVILAFMNILPIPALDGGHIIFLLYEVVTRRKVSEKVMIGAQYIGMAFLILLLVYANGMDIFRSFFK